MLVTLLVWAYSFAIFYLYGRGILILFKRMLHVQDEITSVPFPITVTVGMAVTTTAASFLSLLLPLAGFAAAVILAVGLLVTFRTRPLERFSWPSLPPLIWILLVLAGLGLLENATHAPTNPDTALYHAQAIHWMETYRAVPGLANIHNRLAYNSSWLVLNAAFSFAFAGLQSFHLSNSVLLLSSLLYFGNGPQNLLRRRVTISEIAKSVFFVLSVYLYLPEVASPATDLPATLLIWIVTALTIEKLEGLGTGFDLYSSAIFVLSIYAVVVKLSTLPLAVLAALLVIREIRARDWPRATALAGVGLIILLPWFLRSIVLSGYLIFPLPQIDIFAFDWKFPLDSLIATRDGVLWFARFPNKNWKDYVGLPFLQWMPLWFGNLTLNQKILFLLAAISPSGPLAYKAVGSGQKLPEGYLLAWMINYAGVIFWFITAPDMRFGYGFLLASILGAALPYLVFLTMLDRQAPAFIPTMFVITAILFQGGILLTSAQRSTLRQRLLLPADYLPSRAEPCPIRNGVVFCRKKGYQCNYDNFPCIPVPHPNVEMRGPSLQDGFRYVP